MEAWVWLTVYLVGFALLQLVLYRYFQRRGSASEGPTGSPSDRAHARADAGETSETGGDARMDPPRDVRVDSGPERRADDGEDGVHCKHCGARNEREQNFKYCRRCAQPLR